MASALVGRFWGRMAFARASHDDPEMTSFAPSALHTTAVTVWLAVAQRLASVVMPRVEIHAEPGWRSVSSVACVSELRACAARAETQETIETEVRGNPRPGVAERTSRHTTCRARR